MGGRRPAAVLHGVHQHSGRRLVLELDTATPEGLLAALGRLDVWGELGVDPLGLVVLGRRVSGEAVFLGRGRDTVARTLPDDVGKEGNPLYVYEVSPADIDEPNSAQRLLDGWLERRRPISTPPRRGNYDHVAMQTNTCRAAQELCERAKRLLERCEQAAREAAGEHQGLVLAWANTHGLKRKDLDRRVISYYDECMACRPTVARVQQQQAAWDALAQLGLARPMALQEVDEVASTLLQCVDGVASTFGDLVGQARQLSADIEDLPLPEHAQACQSLHLQVGTVRRLVDEQHQDWARVQAGGDGVAVLEGMERRDDVLVREVGAVARARAKLAAEALGHYRRVLALNSDMYRLLFQAGPDGTVEDKKMQLGNVLSSLVRPQAKRLRRWEGWLDAYCASAYELARRQQQDLFYSATRLSQHLDAMLCAELHTRQRFNSAYENQVPATLMSMLETTARQRVSHIQVSLLGTVGQGSVDPVLGISMAQVQDLHRDLATWGEALASARDTLARLLQQGHRPEESWNEVAPPTDSTSRAGGSFLAVAETSNGSVVAMEAPQPQPNIMGPSMIGLWGLLREGPPPTGLQGSEVEALVADACRLLQWALPILPPPLPGEGVDGRIARWQQQQQQAEGMQAAHLQAKITALEAQLMEARQAAQQQATNVGQQQLLLQTALSGAEGLQGVGTWLGSQVEDLAAALAMAHSSARVTQQGLQQQRTLAAGLQQRLDALQQANSALQARLEQGDRQVAQLRAEVQERERTEGQLRAEAKEKEKTIVQLRADVQEKGRRVALLDQRIRNMRLVDTLGSTTDLTRSTTGEPVLAFRSFHERCLALFLPQTDGPVACWMAFNEGKPHYYLSQRCIARLRLDPQRHAAFVGLMEKITAKQVVEGEDNPFQLSANTTFYEVEAQEYGRSRTRGARTRPNGSSSTLPAPPPSPGP